MSKMANEKTQDRMKKKRPRGETEVKQETWKFMKDDDNFKTEYVWKIGNEEN